MEQFQDLPDFNINSFCRTCLENLNDLEIHYDIFAIPDLQEKLTVCTSLPVKPGDCLPTSLCESCHTKINDFYAFQQMCISASARFQDYINSERKPCSTEFAIYENNPTDFMLITIFKKENEEEEHNSSDIYSNLIDTEPSIKMHNEMETSSNEEADKLEKRQSRNITEYEETLDDNMGFFEKSNSPLNKMNFECEICKKCFKKSATFEMHMRLHQGLKPFPCQLCDKSYSRQCRLKLHIKDKHKRSPDENFASIELGCNKILSSKQTLRQNIMDVPPKNAKKSKQPYICEECGQVQTSLEALENHRYQHTGQQLPHECPQCNKRFTTKNILKEHINQHDNCPLFGVKKTTQKHFNKHIKSRNKEKKYPCQFCEMVYYNIYNVNRHKRIVHEGIKDFPCSYCDKSFGRVETRKHHEMTHTGEKPHECNICHKKFIQIFSLKKHKKVHLNELRKKK